MNETIRDLPELQKPLDSITLKQILNTLLDKKDLELKTEIHNPRYLAILKMWSIHLKERKYPLSSLTIKTFIELILLYMVSYKRQRVKEVIHALSYLLEKEKELSFGSRLTTNLKQQ